jgi:hypothetical protein
MGSKYSVMARNSTGEYCEVWLFYRSNKCFIFAIVNLIRATIKYDIVDFSVRKDKK